MVEIITYSICVVDCCACNVHCLCSKKTVVEFVSAVVWLLPISYCKCWPLVDWIYANATYERTYESNNYSNYISDLICLFILIVLHLIIVGAVLHTHTQHTHTHTHSHTYTHNTHTHTHAHTHNTHTHIYII